ncbi:FbpB family small basic protein [Alkalihalobacillus pseudalcaliphilus]|nr:FbpB family small basic protein [Alkalihalobacillus pseudalcaliphilus]
MRKQTNTLEELIKENRERLLNDPKALSEIEKRIDERNEAKLKINSKS